MHMYDSTTGQIKASCFSANISWKNYSSMILTRGTKLRANSRGRKCRRFEELRIGTKQDKDLIDVKAAGNA
jgi:hypothetical protein